MTMNFTFPRQNDKSVNTKALHKNYVRCCTAEVNWRHLESEKDQSQPEPSRMGESEGLNTKELKQTLSVWKQEEPMHKAIITCIHTF